tara:strand:+ start:507 stop:779 length:273 start_codon:yes stop_codon:yes gene_type:complete
MSYKPRTTFRVENSNGRECNLEGVLGLVVYNCPTSFFLEDVVPNIPDGLKIRIGFSDWMGPMFAITSSWNLNAKHSLTTGNRVDFSKICG